MKQRRLSLLLIFAFGFVILVTDEVPAAAQTTTRRSIVGTTVDPTGAVVLNATVGIVNDGTTIAGDSTGNFVALLFVVKVSAEEPIMNFVSPNFSSVIDSAELKNIPINNRRWSARALTTPGVTVDTSGFVLVNVRGSSDLTNQAQYYECYFTHSNNLANYLTDLYSEGYGVGACNPAVSTAVTSRAAPASVVGQYPRYSTFSLGTMDQGYFPQDDWKLTPRLALQLGMRCDCEGIPNTSTSLTVSTGSFVPYNGINHNFSDKNNIGPRVGFAYDLLGTEKMDVRDSYGLYYGRITNGSEGVALATIGSPLGQSATKATSSQRLAAEPVFPYRFSSASGCRAHRTRG